LARRQGRYIHYRMANPAFLDLIHQAAQIQSTILPELAPSPGCGCPNCRCKREET
jgi:hypothetical protein